MDDDNDEIMDDESVEDGDLEDGDLDEDDLDDDDLDVDDVEGGDDDVDGELAGLDDEVDEEPAVPSRRSAAADDEDGDDLEDEDPDDVEEDLDTILREKIASTDDLEDEEDEVVDPKDPDSADGVTAKRDGEFTCGGCFMIVHPRQFGRKDRLTCPVGDEDCPSLAVVRKQLG